MTSAPHGTGLKQLRDGTAVVIERIEEGSSAWRERQLGVGMRLCSVQGRGVDGLSLDEARPRARAPARPLPLIRPARCPEGQRPSPPRDL